MHCIFRKLLSHQSTVLVLFLRENKDLLGYHQKGRKCQAARIMGLASTFLSFYVWGVEGMRV
jgi:hypothetical protein